MQIKTAIKYHFSLTSLLSLKNIENSQLEWGWMNEASLKTAGRTVNYKKKIFLEGNVAICFKIQMHIYWPRNFTAKNTH